MRPEGTTNLVKWVFSSPVAISWWVQVLSYDSFMALKAEQSDVDLAKFSIASRLSFNALKHALQLKNMPVVQRMICLGWVGRVRLFPKVVPLPVIWVIPLLGMCLLGHI